MGLQRPRDEVFREAVDLLANTIQFEQVTESQKHALIRDPVADPIDPKTDTWWGTRSARPPLLEHRGCATSALGESSATG